MVREYRLIRGEGDGASTATLFIYDVIGFDPWSGTGVTAKKVIEDLAGMDGVTAIDVRVNCPGGDVFEGVAVFNALARHAAEIRMWVDGLAASMASLILMAGDTINVAENALVMVHQPWTIAAGDAPELRAVANTLDKAWSAMLTTYTRRTGKRGASITKAIADGGGEWWMTAAEAVREGFADKVVAPTKDVQAFGISRFKRAPAALAASAATEDSPRRPAVPEALEVAAPRHLAQLGDDAGAAERRRRIVSSLESVG